jgi:hypothetical protein
MEIFHPAADDDFYTEQHLNVTGGTFEIKDSHKVLKERNSSHTGGNITVNSDATVLMQQGMIKRI